MFFKEFKLKNYNFFMKLYFNVFSVYTLQNKHDSIFMEILIIIDVKWK